VRPHAIFELDRRHITLTACRDGENAPAPRSREEFEDRAVRLTSD
jgi:hypothetical protein